MDNETTTRVNKLRSFAACKCGKRFGHTAEEQVTRTTTYHLGMMKTRRASRMLSNPVMQTMCECGARLKWVAVKGRKTDHKCDSRCTHAKGGDCECSCGGENHGRGN